MSFPFCKTDCEELLLGSPLWVRDKRSWSCTSKCACCLLKYSSAFTWKFQSTSPAGLCFPLEVGLLYSEALVVPSGACDLCRDKQLLVPQAEHRQACSVPTTRPYVHRPPPTTSPSGSRFCGRFYLVSQDLEEDKGHLALPPNLPRSGPFANRSQREPRTNNP